MSDWFDLGLAVLALAGALAALWHTHRATSRLRAARRLASDWHRTAARVAAADPQDAERLRFCAYWLTKTLAGEGPR